MRYYVACIGIGLVGGAYFGYRLAPVPAPKEVVKTEIVEKIVSKEVVKTRWLRPDGTVSVEQEAAQDKIVDVTKKEEKAVPVRDIMPSAYELGVLRSWTGTYTVLAGARIGRSPFHILTTVGINPVDVSIGLGIHF